MPGTNATAAVATTTRLDSAQAAGRRRPGKVTGATARVTAAATNTNPISALFFNATPAMNWTVNPGQAANGAITGMLNGTDAEDDPLSYTVTDRPSNGTVAVGGDGSYTYAPSEALAYDGTTDSFTVTASDAGAGLHVHGLDGLLNLLAFGLAGTAGHTATIRVAVTVAAWKRYNTAPVATAIVGGPNPTTGAVVGTIVATDPDGDPLTYSAPPITGKGTVSISANGAFTFTPTASVRHAAASDVATADDLIDSFTVTVSDGQGGTTVVPVTVTIGPQNSAPIAGTPTVGTPNPSTGLVNGTVTATDADNDPLTYNGPGTTTKGTVTVDAGTGAFTYTPDAIGMAASTDIFTVTVTDGYGGVTPVAVVVPIPAWATSNSMVTYAFNYTEGLEYWTADAINALQIAADKVASYIVVNQSVTLTFNVTAYNSPASNVLASAGSDVRGFFPGYYYTVVQNKLIQGIDSNSSSADGIINVNFGQSWAYGDTFGADQYDFVSVMMHEMMHAYGFLSYLGEAGDNSETRWPFFASGIGDWNGNPVIDSSFRFNPALNPNLTGGNGGLYFLGNHAVTAYGGLVPLYTPSEWEAGSSGAHLDDYTFQGTQLMEATTGSGRGVRALSPIEQGILQDLGYTLSAPSWSSMMFIGLGFFIRRRRVK